MPLHILALPLRWLARLCGARRRASRLRLAMQTLLVLVDFWFLAAGILWAEGGGHTVTVLEAIARGGPWWMLLTPLLAALVLVICWRRPAALFTAIWLPGTIAGMIPLAAADPLRQATGLDVHLVAALCIPLGFAYSLIAILLTIGEPIALDNPIARILYLGRYGHLHGLQQMARRRVTGAPYTVLGFKQVETEPPAAWRMGRRSRI